MSTLKFTEDAARQLETFYGTRDVVAQRRATMAKLAIEPGERVIDIGSGPGFLSEDMAVQIGAAGDVLGIDISPDLVALATARCPSDQIRYEVADAQELPAESEAFDVAACTQVAEYVLDVEKVLSEICRVLKPGGRAVVVATDWDCVAWHSDDPSRMARVMQAFEAHCAHPRLPRSLSPLLRAAGFEVSDVDLFPLINLSFDPESYSFGISQLIHDFVVRSHRIDAEEAANWRDEFSTLDAAGQYYFSSGRTLFSAIKPV